jgi:hypothetical protein
MDRAVMRALANGDAVVPSASPGLAGQGLTRTFGGDFWFWARNHHPWLAMLPWCASRLHPTSRRHKLLAGLVCVGSHVLLAVLVAFWAGYCFQRSTGGSDGGDGSGGRRSLLYLDMRTGECAGHDAAAFRGGDGAASALVALLAFPAERVVAALLTSQACTLVKAIEHEAAGEEAKATARTVATRRQAAAAAAAATGRGEFKDTDDDHSTLGHPTPPAQSGAAEAVPSLRFRPSSLRHLRPACPAGLAVLLVAELLCAAWLLWFAPLKGHEENIHSATSLTKIASVAALAEATASVSICSKRKDNPYALTALLGLWW